MATHRAIRDQAKRIFESIGGFGGIAPPPRKARPRPALWDWENADRPVFSRIHTTFALFEPAGDSGAVTAHGKPLTVDRSNVRARRHVSGGYQTCQGFRAASEATP